MANGQKMPPAAEEIVDGALDRKKLLGLPWRCEPVHEGLAFSHLLALIHQLFDNFPGTRKPRSLSVRICTVPV